MGERVKDAGKSKCQAVMDWIGAQTTVGVAPRESGQTSGRSLLTRAFE